MCGRFTITLEPTFFQQELDLGKVPSEWTPRYNVAPSQNIPVVRNPDTRNVEMLRWGLIPFWAKDKSIGYRMINARSETIQEKPSFRNAFKQRRCLILADGFYEWQKPATKGTGTSKAPFRYTLMGNQPFTFAGLWETWRDENEKEIQSCAIITCPPNELIKKVHNRMPVILDKNECWKWLENESLDSLQGMLKPYEARKMIGYSVSQLVNNPRLDSQEVIKPLAF